MEANCPSLKEALVNSRYPSLRGQGDEACLELGFDPVPKETVFNVLQRIGRKPITYENFFPDKKRALLSNLQVKYVEDIIIKRDTANLGIPRKEVIQVISDLGQAKSFVQAENHLDYLIRAKRLTYLKRLERVVSAQANTTERSQICVPQQYRWHMMIEAEWEDLRRTNSPCDIFIRYAHYFQLNLDETCFLCNEGELRIIFDNDKPRHDKNCSDLRFSITVLRVGSAAGVNGPVIFLEYGTNVHPRLRGNNWTTKYGLLEESCVIPNKAAYMDDKTWAKVVKVVAPGTRKMAVINVAFVCSILFSTYLTLHLCSSKFSADDS